MSSSSSNVPCALSSQPVGREQPQGTTPLRVADGTLEALKWLALVLMALDHTNKFLFKEKLPVLFEMGRLAMPTFAFVLAYNLTRPGAFAAGAHVRTMGRLLVFGLLASPMFIAMVGWWPLNILFMLLVFVAMIYLFEAGGTARWWAAIALFVVAGAFVEFWWFGLLICLGAWAYCREPTVPRLVLWVLALLAVFAINRNLWALVALPLLLCAPHVNLSLSRMRWVFYAFYPVHLLLIFTAHRVWFT